MRRLLGRRSARPRSRGSGSSRARGPVAALEHRVVRAAVAERQLERLAGRSRARAAGGRGRCRAPARGRAARARPRPPPTSGSGSPGPFESSTPSKPASVSASTSCGNTVTRAPGAGEPPQDRALRAVVDDRDVDAGRRRRRRTAPSSRRAAASAAPVHRRLRAHGVAAPPRRVALARDDAARIAPRSRRCRTSERVSTPVSADDRRARASQSVHSGPRASRITTPLRVRPRPTRERPLGDAVVADHRRGEADDLLGVARVGDDLLVAGHRGREDRLAERDARRRRRDSPRNTVPSSSDEEAALMPANATRPAATVSRTLPLQRLRRAATSSPSASGSRPRARARPPSVLEQDEVRRRADRDPRARRARRSAPGRPTSARAASRAGAGRARRACV